MKALGYTEDIRNLDEYRGKIFTLFSSEFDKERDRLSKLKKK